MHSTYHIHPLICEAKWNIQITLNTFVVLYYLGTFPHDPGYGHLGPMPNSINIREVLKSHKILGKVLNFIIYLSKWEVTEKGPKPLGNLRSLKLNWRLNIPERGFIKMNERFTEVLSK